MLYFDNVVLVILVVESAHISCAGADVLLTRSDAMSRFLFIIIFFACLDNLELPLEIHQFRLDLWTAVLFLLHVHLDQVVLVSNDVFNLLDMQEIDFAERLASEVSLQADLVLTVQVGLHMVESPGQELMRHALVLTEADLLHQCGVNHVLVVDGIPNVVLLALHDAQHFERVHVVIWLESCNLSSRIITEIYHGCVV